MDGYTERTYGDMYAEFYDDWANAWADSILTNATVSVLQDLMPPNGKALELGVGTGRVAIPLAHAGFEVTGIDSSPEMLKQLRQKDIDGKVRGVLGDMASPSINEKFDVIYAPLSVLFFLPDQDTQIQCFKACAMRLEPHGTLLIEAIIPNLGVYQQNRTHFEIPSMSADEVIIGLNRLDPVKQIITGQRLFMRAGKEVIFLPTVIRYAFPAELDLMAKSAGLVVSNRWSSWEKSPFTSRSLTAVTSYVLE